MAKKKRGNKIKSIKEKIERISYERKCYNVNSCTNVEHSIACKGCICYRRKRG